jgi:hypothetical protein
MPFSKAEKVFTDREDRFPFKGLHQLTDKVLFAKVHIFEDLDIF